MCWPVIIQDPIEGDEEWEVEGVEDYKVWAIKRPLDFWDDKWQPGPHHTLIASRYITYSPLQNIMHTTK